MNLTKETEQYVIDHPSIKDSLRKGLINYSKLSRQIISETDLKPKNFDAVLVALRRLEYNLKKKSGFERKIKDLLKKTKLEIKSKVSVFIIEKTIFDKNLSDLQKSIKEKNGELQIIEGINVYTIITTFEFETQIKKYFKNSILKETNDLVEIILRSPEDLEDIPGFLGYLYSLFAEYNVNIVESMSCWTDTIFIIEKKNVEKIIKLLSF